MRSCHLIKVSPHIWCIQRPSYLTCSYLVKTNQGIYLLDAGMDSEGQDMLWGFKQLNWDLRELQAILLTHWHNDHAAGAQYLQKLTGCRVYYHEQEAPFLMHRQPKDWRKKLSDWIPEAGPLVLFKGLLGNSIAEPVTATAWLTDTLMLEGLFKVITTPGHTAGHVAYYYPTEKALFCGDAMAVVGHQACLMSRIVTPDIEQARHSVYKCLALDIQLLCPGHRYPLTQSVPTSCTRLQNFLDTGATWPWWGVLPLEIRRPTGPAKLYK